VEALRVAQVQLRRGVGLTAPESSQERPVRDRLRRHTLGARRSCLEFGDHDQDLLKERSRLAGKIRQKNSSLTAVLGCGEARFRRDWTRATEGPRRAGDSRRKGRTTHASRCIRAERDALHHREDPRDLQVIIITYRNLEIFPFYKIIILEHSAVNSVRFACDETAEFCERMAHQTR
jgi:hypothetical protein